jgi:imidazolonepropionase-like amidohydrolase
VLAGRLPVLIEADSRDEIERAMNFAAELKLTYGIFGGRDAWKLADQLKKQNVPVVLRVDFSEPSGRRARATTVKALAERKRLRAQEVACAQALAKAGVRFAISTQGLPADKPWEKFRIARREMLEAGLGADVLFAALTAWPADIYGVTAQLGSLEKGKAAHIVMAEGNLWDPGSRVSMVFVDGVRFAYDEKASPPEKPLAKLKEKEKKDKKDASKGPKEKDTPDYATEVEADRMPFGRTGGNVLITGATVITAAGPAQEKTDILVSKGKIEKIGKGLAAPTGTPVIKADGMFVMPGIIDTHCHFAISGGVNEASLSVVPEVRVRDVINSEDVQIFRALAGGVTTARLLHGSANVIGGQDAVIKLKYGRPTADLLVTDGPRGVKFALGENVKRTDGRFPNTRLGVEAVLVRAFTEAKEYARVWKKYREDVKDKKDVEEPRRDLRLEALAEVLSGDLKIHCHCYRADEILMLMRVCDKFGVKVASLQHVLEGYKVAAEIAKHGASCSPFSDWWAYKWEAADAIPYCAALLHEAGVSVCLKSDSNELMRHMYQEAAKVMKYGGMSELEAIRTITLNGAKQLGIQKRTGSIEEGKDADLAIFNGHPLNGYSRCEMTLVEGEVYFMRSKELVPYPIAAKGPVPPLKKPWATPTKSKDGRYLLCKVTAHIGTGVVLPNATVVIDGGKVRAVREWNESDIGIDCTGLHVYPGMIDAGSVLGLIEVNSARETSDHREGGDFQPDLRASTGINPDSALIPVTRANGVLTVVTRPTGSVIAGQSALINLAGWVPSDMAIVDPLALHIELPGGFAGIGRRSPFGRASLGVARKSREVKLKKLRELFEQALVYSKAGDRTKPNPRLEALAPYARGQKPVIIQANRREEILEAIKLIDDLKLKGKGIISGGIDAWKVADELKKRNIPVLLGPILTLPTERTDPYDAPFSCAAKLYKAGVRFCIRSAGDNNTRNLPYHAAMAVSYGLPPQVALKAVTQYPAEILGVGNRLGTVVAGKDANLVISTGDILQPTTQVVGLFIAGKPVSAESKHTKLYERYLERLHEIKGARKR